jgi:hypothetical protein
MLHLISIKYNIQNRLNKCSCHQAQGPANKIICMTLKLIALRLVGSLQTSSQLEAPLPRLLQRQLWEYELRKYMQQRRKRLKGKWEQRWKEDWKQSRAGKRKRRRPPRMCSYRNWMCNLHEYEGQNLNRKRRGMKWAMYTKEKLYRDAMAFLTPEWDRVWSHLL